MWIVCGATVSIPGYNRSLDVRRPDVPAGRLCGSDPLVRLSIHLHVDISGPIPRRPQAAPLRDG